MKCQNLISGKNKKNKIQYVVCWKFYPVYSAFYDPANPNLLYKADAWPSYSSVVAYRSSNYGSFSSDFLSAVKSSSIIQNTPSKHKTMKQRRQRCVESTLFQSCVPAGLLIVSSYSRILSARKSLGPWTFVLDMGRSCHWGLIITQGQRANGDNLGMSFRSSIK